MTKGLIKWIYIISILFLVFQSPAVVKADHDDDEEWEWLFEKRDRDHDDHYDNDHDDYDDDEEEDRHDEDHDDDDYDDRENVFENRTDSTNLSQWNTWIREVTDSSNGTLPIQEAQKINIQFEAQNESFYIVPKNGQLLVSAEKFAQLIQGEFRFYEQSKILEVTKRDKELIVRSGTNAAYENMIKMPMPTEAVYMENSVYIPISVIANAFDYRVSWDEANEAITLEEI